MSSSTCNLDPNGVAPAEFINPNVVPQQAITALAAQSPRVYGCVQFTQVGSSTQVANGQWWCATTTPSDERKSLGRATNCAVTTKEQACQAPWVWVQKQRPPPGQDVGAYVFGCTRDDGKFICQGGQSCSPQGLSSSGEPVTVDSTSSGSSTTGIVIGVSILLGCLLVGGLGFFFWKRTRNHRLPASSPSGPGGVAAAYAGAKVSFPRATTTPLLPPARARPHLSRNRPTTQAATPRPHLSTAAGYPISSSGASSGGGSAPGAAAVIALNTIPAKPQRSNSATSRYLSPREAERARLVAAPSPILDETDLVTVPVSPNMMASAQAMSPQMMAQQQQQHPQYASVHPLPSFTSNKDTPNSNSTAATKCTPPEYQSHLHHSPAAAMSPPPTASSPCTRTHLITGLLDFVHFPVCSAVSLEPWPGISRHFLVPARPSLSEPALPSLSVHLAAQPTLPAHRNLAAITTRRMFPRPYRTYVNMDAAAPVVQAEQPGKGN
ncbi:hypothetical protein BCR44DRAFT_1495561, partial [Catenaria anguillulae PL171]